MGDPEPSSGIAKPREPDDIDAGILIDETDYASFLDEMETIIDDLRDAIKFKDIRDYQALKDGLKISQDMFNYKLLDKIPVGNSTFLDKIRDATKPFTNFNHDKINFAIIKKGGKYDGKPNVSFKF